MAIVAFDPNQNTLWYPSVITTNNQLDPLKVQNTTQQIVNLIYSIQNSNIIQDQQFSTMLNNLLTNRGITSATGTAHQIIVSASTGAVTFSTPQNIGTTSSPQFQSMGLGTPALSTSTLILTPTGSQNQSANTIQLANSGTAVNGFNILSNSGAVETILGTDRSTGGGLGVGTAGYATVFGSAGSNVVQFITNNTLALTLDTSQRIKYEKNNTTGSGTALLGSNSPSAHLSAPYTWIDCVAADGTVCTMPIWQK